MPQLIAYFSDMLDRENWQNQTAVGFSGTLHSELVSAHDLLSSDNPNHYDWIVGVLGSFTSGQGSLTQQRNLHYVLGRCSLAQYGIEKSHRRSGEHEMASAISRFRTALSLAKAQGAWPEAVSLRYWEGTSYHWSEQHKQAYCAYQMSEKLLGHISPTEMPTSAILAMRFDLALRMAGHAWEYGDFPTAQRHRDEADALYTQLKNDPRLAHEKFVFESVIAQAHQVDWITAMLANVSGQFIEAYRSIRAAINAIETYGHQLNMGRLHAIAAEYAINLVAAQYPHDPVDHPVFTLPGLLQDTAYELDRFDMGELIKFAQHALTSATGFALDRDDSIGDDLIRLSHRRVARLINLIKRVGHSPAETFRIAANIEQVAEQKHDVSLQGRAIMAQGDALLTPPDTHANDPLPPGNLAGACYAYAKALVLFQTHNLGGLSFWPRQKLRALAGRAKAEGIILPTFADAEEHTITCP